MKQDNKKCGYCGSFSAYYTRAYCSLFKENNGYCNRHKKITEKSDSCDRWCCRYTPKKRRVMAVVNAIPEIYNKIAVIEQLLSEDAELLKLRDETD